jgi:hypothetical protein
MILEAKLYAKMIDFKPIPKLTVNFLHILVIKTCNKIAVQDNLCVKMSLGSR